MIDDKEELRWLFGNAFDERFRYEAAHKEVLWSRLLRTLRTDANVQNTWAEIIRDYRDALIESADAPKKCAVDVEISAYDFDDELKDALAEWMACQKLAELGFDSFRVLVPPLNQKNIPKSPDFLASYEG